MSQGVLLEKQIDCFHCGELCEELTVVHDSKSFCCHGCRAVYELFQETDLQDIYDARKEFKTKQGAYEHLNNPDILNKLLSFQSDDYNKVKLILPAVHCSSCVYLLENLNRLHNGVIRVNLNFTKKEADLHYNPAKVSLVELSELLASIGYPPKFDAEPQKKTSQATSRLSMKIGIAAFCFGNIMLLSFPEYFGFDELGDNTFSRFFAWINIALTLPIILYAGNDYFISAWKGLKKGFINIDVPIALGILTLFLRSLYEVITAVGPGYQDSLAGLVFFLLIGKWFQSKTYDNLSFERDYKSYFPLAVLKQLENKAEVSTPIQDLKPGDKIMVRNEEIIPADSVLLDGVAHIDYSFVTGESRPVKVRKNEIIYAGGRQIGERILLKLTKPTSHSYLTELWNNPVFKKTDLFNVTLLINKVSRYFTLIVLSIAGLAAGYWLMTDPKQVWTVISAVLIVACPCALALSAPFANGNAIRILGRNKFYLKNADVVECLSSVDTIVFDKTGTITSTNSGQVNYEGETLEAMDTAVLAAMTANSTHPLSKQIGESLKVTEPAILQNFSEKPGLGLTAQYNNNSYKLGSEEWVSGIKGTEKGTKVFISKNKDVLGYFCISYTYRKGLLELVQKLRKRYEILILSGDNDHEREKLASVFGDRDMYFNQSPDDKLQFVEKLQQKGKKVMMLGDGLNDAGALKCSHVGIAVTDDVASFSPACDGIVLGEKLSWISKVLEFASNARRIVMISFIISFAYNVLGIGLAVSGMLTPLIAAILMPVSSISVVVFATLGINYMAKKRHLM
ncbi:HAD-IC family P-type ATPase [Fulvivirga sp. M361]|uniref:heavy metal translocating P-type ATPase n=1 Tax=Fulvivirga sp. M361 TaxID=2594266 RepID=UPI001179EE95|nr:heavy metal translocating P-type ATPase metal-binding domain-containing protein [Fulvivirga sp. M361]TRX52657.1 HAD-IC family P-type ATPase [Fulvivirga sp. M361]